MIHAVIMAGGSGSRFWPESRNAKPKQLLPVAGGLPLIVETANRLQPAVAKENIWVVTNHEQAQGVRQLLPWLDDDRLLIEPCARNTAAAVGLAATAIRQKHPQDVCVFVPADHLIGPHDKFQEAIIAAQSAAMQPGALVTFGITPTYPATGYGYIQRAGNAIAGGINLDAWAIESFTEKPDLETAKGFIDEGIYFWNSGIFAWRIDTIISAIGRHMPKLAEALGEIRADFQQSTIERVYEQLDSIPIDVGIMEKARGGIIIRAPFEWSDIGSWQSLYDILEKDSKGNATVFNNGGQLLTEDANGILASASEEHAIAVIGLDDIVVVHTADATLVCKRSESERVKEIVAQLKSAQSDKLL